MNNLYHHCGYPRCMRWVQDNNRYCDEHHKINHDNYVKAKQANNTLHRKAMYRQYNQTKRDLESTKFYRSKQWRQVRDYRLALDKYTCQACGKAYQVRYLTADHIVMRKLLKPDKQLDVDNLWTLCSDCNSIKQRLEQNLPVQKLRTLKKVEWQNLILKNKKYPRPH